MNRLIEKKTTEEIFSLWNTLCEKNNCTERQIHTIYEFNDVMAGMSPLEIADKLYGAQFSTGDSHWAINAFGNICSFSEKEEAIEMHCINEDKLAKYIEKNRA